MVFKEIKREQTSSFINQFPIDDLALEREKPKPPTIPTVKEPSKVEMPSSMQIPITQNAKDALVAAVDNYSGNFADYVVQTSGMLYCIVPCKGEAKLIRGKVAEYRQFDFSGTQREDGANLIISTEKTYVEACKNNSNDVPGTATAYGFDGATFDQLSTYMSAKGFAVEQALDPWGNEVPGMIRFNYTDGDKRIKTLEALRDFKTENNILDLGSTPAMAYATAASDMIVQRSDPSAINETIDSYLTRNNVTVSALLSDWKEFSADHWHAGQKYISFKGKIDEQEQNLILRKDNDGRLILEQGIEGGAMTDGTYFSNTAAGGYNDRVYATDQMLNAVTETFAIYGSKLDISLLNRPEQANETDPTYKTVVQTIDPNLTTSSSGYILPPVTMDITMKPNYSQAFFVTETEYKKYLDASNTETPPSGITANGTNLTITSSAANFSANATGYLPFSVQMPPDEHEKVFGCDPSGSMGGPANQMFSTFLNYSKQFNIGFDILPYDGTNYNVQNAGNLLNSTKEKVIAKLGTKNIPQDQLDSRTALIVQMGEPELKFTCDLDKIKTKIKDELGITLTKTELDVISRLNNSAEGIPYLLERNEKKYSLHYNDGAVSVQEVPMVSFLNSSHLRYDVVKEIGPTGDAAFSIYNRGSDFDNYKQYFDNVMGSTKENYDLYLAGDWGNVKITQDEATDIAAKLKDKGIRVFTTYVKGGTNSFDIASTVASGTGGGIVKSTEADASASMTTLLSSSISATIATDFNDYLTKITQMDTPDLVSLTVSKKELTQASTGTINIDNILTK